MDERYFVDMEPSTASVGSIPSMDDLVMLVKQLVRHLKKANPSDELSARAMDYLKRHNLEGSPLRTGHRSAPKTGG